MRARSVRRLVTLLLCAAGVSLPSPHAGASLVLALDLSEMTASAEQIVVAEVLAVRSGWNRAGSRIVTTVELKVAESWKGTVPGDGRVTLVQPGGVADGLETRVHGMPSFAAGERAVLFLGRSAVVGMAQGKRDLRWDQATRRWMTAAPDRGAAVTLDARGTMRPAPPEEPMPLDELRRRVRALLKP